MTFWSVLVIFALVVIGVSARWNWWRPRKNGIPILMYHKVGNPPPDSKLKKLWVSADQLREQMSYLASHGYTPILFKDLYRHWDKKSPLPPKPVLITFDDGYANNFENALPIL